ncbi:histidine phosphatase family protein [Pseudoalteromonas sp. JBTF-M23]|uniref:Histidine phosphatase family protein n=1 Tax=Pseudoalteromonas caenipelagi TaxID=2726988 RepID=A0A849VD55_9GAMM|nr:histidine phosphatase family protein [Pseudoalteromonas caenipelagi]NOU51236.1 histidine phosphatase family protein [Pseudoalteromonas caenipelagi]
MTTRLIVVRHGNTFLPTDTPTRVGARTDLDLVEQVKGTAVGHYLRDNQLVPDVVYAGPLKRHQQTAKLICGVLNIDEAAIQKDEFLNEIDYGPDENQVEDAVMKRLGNGDLALGKSLIDKWNKEAQVPPGWLVNPDELRAGWHAFAQNLLHTQADSTTLMVSSNGIMRFSHVIDPMFNFSNLKVPTGGICIFENDTGKPNDWRCVEWGLVPK